MKKILTPACFVIASALALSSCSNAQSNNTSAATEQAAQDPHAGHDHSAHSASEDHASAPTSAAQTAPAQAIPAFTFYKVKSGMSFSNNDIPQGKKTVFILFDPGCSHCQTEAAALGKNYNKIKDINIYFVSMNDPAMQASFLETFGKELVGKPNIEVLYDKNQDFIQKFHIPKQFPANYVYGADMKLQTSWDGERDINQIIEAYTK
ncbi:redoxin domain-containing protein [Sphingobacterium rhinopitheci]|uniref:redoxin domain-containing protein n=1 Tax=Sphingobacterium rhinopitheci TaxID=2781960 RepID=UPI001F5260EE|nr:redoxin domain-containing protein [Sphingobacterium rhinopitheci]MCI0920072.1 redoxin domain-containing protein [Sphingobacterium rhinopitheci]